jgi:SSS family solute:Na+ symporter
MVAGFLVVLLLEYLSPESLPWSYGLTSGVIALAVNAAIYVSAAYLFPMPHEERNRVDALFAQIANRSPREVEKSA